MSRISWALTVAVHRPPNFADRDLLSHHLDHRASCFSPHPVAKVTFARNLTVPRCHREGALVLWSRYYPWLPQLSGLVKLSYLSGPYSAWARLWPCCVWKLTCSQKGCHFRVAKVMGLVIVDISAFLQRTTIVRNLLTWSYWSILFDSNLMKACIWDSWRILTR